MSGYAHQPGLWSTSEGGVLARQGDLVLLCSLVDSGLLDTLLDLLARTANSGGDGGTLADVIEDTLAKEGGWAAGERYLPGPALLAFGPFRAGLTVTVSGTAWAEIGTVHGTQRLEVSQPSLLLRCTLGSPVVAVHGGLRASRGEIRTDRFSRLDSGTVRAGSLSYYTGHPAAPAAPAAPEPAAPDTAGVESAGAETEAFEMPAEPRPARPRPAEPRPARPRPADVTPAEQGRARPARARPEPAEPAAAEPELAETEAFEMPGEGDMAADRGPAASSAAPPPSAVAPPPKMRPAGRGINSLVNGENDNAAAGDEAGRPFDAVLLARGAPPDAALPDVGRRPPLPLAGTASEPGEQSAGAAAPPQIMGAYCKNGHFDDPDARFCAVCGISMNQLTLTPRLGPRPPLGVLVLDDGAVLQLDADYVLGREPGLDPAVGAGTARALPVTDDTGTVSRVHALIELVDWRVQVTDLGSANGTRILPADSGAGQQLIPRVPAALLPGSRIDLGGRELRYESHRGR